jgi:hypothetical protein
MRFPARRATRVVAGIGESVCDAQKMTIASASSALPTSVGMVTGNAEKNTIAYRPPRPTLEKRSSFASWSTPA